MSIAAKFSLRALILENWNLAKLKTASSCLIDSANDTMLVSDCNFVGIYQLPDISSGKTGGAYDIFVIRYFWTKKTGFDEIDADIAFGLLTDIFKRGVNDRQFLYASVTYRDDFEYIEGSENRAGRQVSGNKLTYKQFTVRSPKTNIL